MFSIKRFFKEIPKDFLNIYKDKPDNNSPNENMFYTNKENYIDPVTGKKKVSAKKIIYRILMIGGTALFIFILFRIGIK